MKITDSTEDAERLLHSEIESLGKDLRRAAYLEALRSRGEPVEITASDVERARERLVWKRAPLSSLAQSISQLYIILGLLLFAGGLGYPWILRTLQNESGILSLLVSLTGTVMVLLGLFSRFYFEHISTLRSRFTYREPDNESAHHAPYNQR